MRLRILNLLEITGDVGLFGMRVVRNIFMLPSSWRRRGGKLWRSARARRVAACVPPIMVEGYAELGSPDKQFRESQLRAAVVQEYLQARFQLNPKLVGSIPLGDSPPESSGKKDWSGVALVLLP
jgi:hypothetical protein